MSFHPYPAIFALLSWHCVISQWCPHIGKRCHYDPNQVDLVSKVAFSCGVVVTVAT
jgi:hypothetical protein